MENPKKGVLYIFLENRAVEKIMRENIVEPGMPHMTILYGACFYVLDK
jgi:hypothetical protein